MRYVEFKILDDRTNKEEYISRDKVLWYFGSSAQLTENIQDARKEYEELGDKYDPYYKVAPHKYIAIRFKD